MENEEVENQVGDIFLDLGCNRRKDTKFYINFELCWHMKSMVAQGRAPQEQGIRNLNQRMEVLERQSILLITMVS